VRYSDLTPEERQANPDFIFDPWDEVAFAAKKARNTYYPLIERLEKAGEVGEVHRLSVAYSQAMALVWIAETLEPIRCNFNRVLEITGMADHLDNGAGGPPAGA
jgi:hypothetical protein